MVRRLSGGTNSSKSERSAAQANQDFLKEGLSISLIVLGVVLRLLPHPPNFAPISAIALFGGVYLARPYAIVLPLLAMFASDMIGEATGLFPGFHRTMPAVYGSFVIIGLLGLWIRAHKSVVTVISGAVAASVLFFFITNFAVWYEGLLYPKTFDGLLTAYIAGIPFYRNTLLSDLFYTGALFGAYEFVKRTIFSRRTTTAHQRL
jgi:hypothetical protein